MSQNAKEDETIEELATQPQDGSPRRNLDSVGVTTTRSSRKDPTPFLDTFYGLSSADLGERTNAAREMIHYCLTGPERNTKDAFYAMKRLMTGLCSGRAAARQGCASALATFLKISYRSHFLDEIQAVEAIEKEKSLSSLAFVRHLLLKSTTSTPSESSGRRKRSDDRNDKFGRLFGILAIIRSGILLPVDAMDDEEDSTTQLEQIRVVSLALTQDLAELFHWKAWMREPAAHAIATLLKLFYDSCSHSTNVNSYAVAIVTTLVGEAVVPEIFLRQSTEASGSATGGDGIDLSLPSMEHITAEHMALGLFLQAESSFHSISLPDVLNQPLLTPNNLPSRMPTLLASCRVESETRTHLVWDAVLQFVTEPSVDEESQIHVVDSTVAVRRLRNDCHGNVNAIDLVAAILQHVVCADRTEDSIADETMRNSSKITAETASLGLWLVACLSGVEWQSTLTGPTRLVLDNDAIERAVFRPVVIQSLLTDALGGTGSNNSHTLRRMASLKPSLIQTLEAIVDLLDADQDNDTNGNRRLAFAKPLLQCQPRFDSKTKTDVMARLVQADHLFRYEKDPQFFQQLIGVVVQRIAMSGSPECPPSDSLGHLELLFWFGKTAISPRQSSNNVHSEASLAIVQRVQGVLLCMAFFDCHTMKTRTRSKRKSSEDGSAMCKAAMDAASVIKTTRASLLSALPDNVREIAASRLFSTLASASSKGPRNKDDDTLKTLLRATIASMDELEKAGGTLVNDTWKSSASSEMRPPREVVTWIQKQTARLTKQSSVSTRDELVLFSSTLEVTVMALYLAVIGSSVTAQQEGQQHHHDDEQRQHDAAEFLTDIEEAFRKYLESKEPEFPLTALTTLCIGMLSSTLSVATHSSGAFPTLLKGAVMNMWAAGLRLVDMDSASYYNESKSVVSILLEAIGVSELNGTCSGMIVEDDPHTDSDSDSDSDAGSESTSDVPIDAMAIGAGSKDEESSEGEDEEEELQPAQLQSLLEEESDVELEHHEGADAALARLIQDKQDARKAGQMAQARSQLAGNVRCIPLLETLAGSKSRSRTAFLYSDTVVHLILSVVVYRKTLETSVGDKNATAKSSSITSERRALLDRVTALLKNRLLKWKFATSQWENQSNAATVCSDACSRLVVELKGRMSNEQRKYCSLSLISVLRSAPDVTTRFAVASVYDGVIAEWASKRTTRLDSSLLDDLINTDPVLAQAVLPVLLADAATFLARSSFIKVECMRLLGKLYNAKINRNSTDLERLAYDRIKDAIPTVAKALANCVGDLEMRKAKRAREVLQCLERVLAFTTVVASSSDDSSTVEDLLGTASVSALKEQLGELKTSSGSDKVNGLCDRLLGNLASAGITN